MVNLQLHHVSHVKLLHYHQDLIEEVGTFLSIPSSHNASKRWDEPQLNFFLYLNSVMAVNALPNSRKSDSPIARLKNSPATNTSK